MKYLPLILLLVLAGCGSDEDGADPHEGHDHTRATTLTSEADDETRLYTCGMHPDIVQEGPGQCPICGMDLTPIQRSASSEGVVSIDPTTIQNMGVRTERVRSEPLGRTVRTTGRFEADERANTAVAPKIGGWVERLHVNYEGARVQKGQPLLEIYSPELVSTQEEYLLARRNAERLADGPAEADAQRLLEAARRRLSYWDVSEAQIRRLEESGRPAKNITLHAPASGTVTLKNVVEGQQVRPGQTLMELANLSRLWLMVDVYEQDLAWIDVGTAAAIELPYQPGTTLSGRVEYLYDALDPEARTVEARVTVPNPGLRLKPGMYATVTLRGDRSEATPTVADEAVLRTGEREVVLLAVGDGRFQPREVTTGVQSDGRVQILSGLEGGEEVVTSAQFLIDSEARLRSAIGAMTSDNPANDAVEAPTDPEAQVVDVAAADTDGDGLVWQCPMDWHVLHDEEGRCEVCGMFLKEYTTGEARQNLLDAGYEVAD